MGRTGIIALHMQKDQLKIYVDTQQGNMSHRQIHIQKKKKTFITELMKAKCTNPVYAGALEPTVSGTHFALCSSSIYTH